MAAFEEGVQYGLSAHGHSSENKSLVFVKLTDSSFKAIEEYLRIKRLWFPSAEEGRGSAFSFNLSSSSVAGGPQGSFECVQQCGYQSLESLGVMGLKMNIKAKDDVYEATRQRMAVAEEESKKNWYVTHISLDTLTPHFEPLRALKDGYANGSGSMVEANPDLMKRPLRERLIHMLAIRSYKKPELVTRLHKEGLKEKDKKLIMNVLSAIGLMKDQAYHLARHIWNDVHDDWPFYTDQEKQILKR
ncbi:hypothetical protein DAPPUDRAFT_317378 [Daphnia pulex]|uniref:RNA polymerase II elongation factor ELL N-terminal domain-containing protein n=1 Tax=Daphnia pulex TaxID=6669 RepID=E9GFT1_DAPPU|nr:hypothetical protein DAPPUDRAFT_317378 [Daphnia pulex]|eukprot:EFX81756.1 hypothetical protein DAPPUDRAFT_317378 [Daphnia pulex]